MNRILRLRPATTGAAAASARCRSQRPLAQGARVVALGALSLPQANGSMPTTWAPPLSASCVRSFSSTPRPTPSATAASEPMETRAVSAAASSAAVATTTAASSSSTATATAKKVKPKALEWNVRREIINERRSLPEVFAGLRREVARRGLRSNHVRQGIDAFYFHCAQQLPTLDRGFVSETIAFFEKELLGGATADASPEQTAKPRHITELVNEGAVASIVRLYVARGNVAAAWTLVHRMAAPTGDRHRVHFRTVGPILDFECRQGRFLDAQRHWRELKNLDMEWTKTMEDTLVQLIVACQRHHRTRDLASGPFVEDMTELLTDLRLAVKAISPESALRLRSAFSDAGYGVKALADDSHMIPECSCCRTRLTKIRPTEEERQRLVHAIETYVPIKNKSPTTTKDFLAPFRKWILAKNADARAQGKLHFVLDGPNLAYLNQNYDNGSFRFDHIDHVVRMLQAEGHVVSITIPFSYLEETSRLHIRTKKAKQLRRKGKIPSRRRTASEKALIERWRSENLLFSCRTDYISDDIFWLYASALMGDEARVVTNDQGRDHVFRLLENRTSGMTTADLRDPTRVTIDLLERWRGATIVNIEIQHRDPNGTSIVSNAGSDEVSAAAPVAPIPIDDVQLVHPAPFSRIPQISASGASLHFPIDDQSKQWLCIHRRSGADAAA